MSIASVQKVTTSITTYTPYILLVLGNIGCLYNFLTFTAKQLRRNSCGWYLLMSALSDFCFINFGLSTKIASEQFGSKLQNSNLVWCKIRTNFTWILPCFATGFLILAALDRCLSTSESVQLRSFSQLKVAHRMTCVPILLYSLTTAHQFFYFVLRSSCVPLPGAYSYFLSMYSIVWTSLIPQSTVLILGLITYLNIRKSHQRAIGQPSRRTPRSRTDSQMIIITLVQVICSSVLLNIRTGYYSYTVLSTGLRKSVYRNAVETLILQISSFVFYFNFSKGFFVNTLSSKLFRRIYKERVAVISRRMTWWKVRVHPLGTTRVDQTRMKTMTNLQFK